MSTPLELEPGGAMAPPEAVLEGAKHIEGRSLGQIAWTRLKRDKVALAGGVFVIFLVLVAFLAPLIVNVLGHPPERVPPGADRPGPGRSRRALRRRVSGTSCFGVEPVNGRDLFSRILYGAQISLLVAFLATIVSVVIGTIAGHHRRLLRRLRSTAHQPADGPLPGLPAAAVRHRPRRRRSPTSASGSSGDSLRIAVIVFIIGFFSWPYIGRIVRGQTLSLREREFVDAARSLGARAALHPAQGPAAQPGRADPRLRDPAHPDATSSSRPRCPTSASGVQAAARLVGRHARPTR